MELVVRYSAVAVEALVNGHVLGLIGVFLRILNRGIIKHRVLLYLTADLLLQFLDGKFDEMNGLNLQRGQFLLLLEFQSLFDRCHD